MSSPAATVRAGGASAANVDAALSSDDESAATVGSAATGASGGAAGASNSKSARKRRKRNAASKAQQQAGAAAAAHQHNGALARAHSHSHEHGIHGGHGGGHSHDGVPCGGHGGGAMRPGGDVHANVDPDDLSEAVHYCDVLYHFTSYARHSFERLERMQADFQSIPTVLQSLVPGHAARMGDLRRAVRLNHAFLNEIVKHRYVFQSSDEIDYDELEARAARDNRIDEERMSKVRSTLRQCVRDWSAEGAAERRACYGPILDELERLYPDQSARSAIRVLVPGSGLGRLVWEVAARGFHSSGNEFSYFMLLCSFLILNCCKEKNIFEIFPYVHDAKNLYRPEDQLRSVRIPDVDPSSLPVEGGSLSMAAGDWMDIFSDLPVEYIHGGFKRVQAREKRRAEHYEIARRKWDVARKEHAKIAAAAAATGAPVPPAPQIDDEVEDPVPDPVRHPGWMHGPLGEREAKPSNEATWDVFASCYFIDCATNILEFLRTIAYVLKPGGHWINFGPLLYHYSDVPREVSVDLTWAELRAAAPAFGFQLLREELEQPSAYTSDDKSMLRSHYYCVSCTWQKVGPDQTRAGPLRSLPPAPTSVAWNTRLAAASADPSLTTLAVDSEIAAKDGAVDLLLQAKSAKTLRERAALPSGALVNVYQLPVAHLSAFLLQAVSATILLGKVELEGIELLALMRK
jgi:carnosine N-methyltransferase